MAADRAALAWQAAGIRQELLMRVLPAIRHDMAGPLSVARMGNSVLKRYLTAQPFDAEQSRKRLEQTDEQLNQLLVAIRGLGRWDTDSSERIDAATALRTACHMARPILDLHGMSLLVPEALEPSLAWPLLQPARALYGVIGALSYLQDTAAGSSTLHIGTADQVLRLEAQPGGSHMPDDFRPAGRALQIDAVALSCLAQDLQWPMDIQAGAVLLQRPAEL